MEFRYLEHMWKNNKEIALAALFQNGHALYYVFDNLKNGWDFILFAVTQERSVLVYASEALKSNKKTAPVKCA